MLRPYQQNLITRLREAYKKGYKSPCIVSPCGSGKSVLAAEVARRTTSNGNRVLFLVHRKELCEQIEDTFKNWGVNMDLCQVSMVQTITQRLKTTAEPKLIITDENHHAPANSYKKIYDYFPQAVRVGFTATPSRLNGSGLGDVNDKLIIGPTVKELINWGNLSPYKYYAPEIVNTARLRVRAGEFRKEDIEELFSKRAIYGDVIKHYKKLSFAKKAICYCSSISQSRLMAAKFKKAGIPAEHIDGETPKTDRAEAIKKFRSGEILILCNVDLISEGFDVPDCNTSILLRPTKSLTLYVQQAMRCMRYQPDKTAVIIDHVGNVGRFGLPDAEREWTLEVKSKANSTETDINIKTCHECLAVYKMGVKTCPICGHVNEIEQTETVYVPDAELKEFKQEIIFDYRKPEDCKNITELQEYAKAKNYKPGWVWYQAKMRNFI